MIRAVIPVAMAAFMSLAVEARAQEPVFSAEATEACLASEQGAVSPDSCVGLSSEACYTVPGVYSNVAMGFCYGKEAEYWDGRLNRAYVALFAHERGLMEEMREIGATVPDAAAALRDMQRAWIGYRDASCDYEYTTWGGGSGAGPAHSACIMTLTAAQALRLEKRLAERQN